MDSIFIIACALGWIAASIWEESKEYKKDSEEYNSELEKHRDNEL